MCSELFPGLVSLVIIAWVLVPAPMHELIRMVCEGVGLGWTQQTRHALALAAYLWTSACMFAAWAIYLLDRVRRARPVVPLLVAVVGFGPLLCAVTFAAYVAQFRGAATTWDKTEKTGKVAAS